MKKIQWVLLWCFFSASFVSYSQSSVADTARSINRKLFFANDNPIELTIQTDFRKMKTEKERRKYQKATVTFRAGNSDPVTEEIGLYARGEFRREYCQMPGIMLNFKAATAPVLSPLKKMKMVCACGPTNMEEQLLLMEYLTYKMYNQLTDTSFRVKLMKVEYKDVAQKFKPYTQYAFVIEDVDDMAARLQCKEIEGARFVTEATDRSQMTLVALFQYMIGNTDWAVPNYHNIKLVQPLSNDRAQPLVVPYDFDFTGLVNAPYAIPHPELKIDNVRERLYRGFPRSINELENTFEIFKKERENITALVSNFELLSKKNRDNMLQYLNSFYRIIDNKRKVENLFIYGARKE